LPTKGSNTCFNATVKHFFRHLHEPELLRTNSLAARFFDVSGISDSGQHGARTTLTRIHDLVRRAAQHCRDIDLDAGKGERALRQYAIATMQCLSKRPIQEVATVLGISCKHCYRERAEICQRIAHYISDYDDTTASDHFLNLDEFQFRMDRAMQQSPFADMEAATREIDKLIGAAPSPQQKIDALRLSGIFAIGFGNIKRAEEAYAAAKALYPECLGTGEPSSQRIAQACMDLLGFRLESYRANTGQALRLAQRATSWLESVPLDIAPRVRELYIESLYQLAVALGDVGQMQRMYELLVKAELNTRSTRALPSWLRTRVTVALWKSRNHFLISSRTWYPLQQRLNCLATAFDQAYTAGALLEAIDALDALTECYAFAGNDAGAFQAARRTLLLVSEVSSERIRLQVLIRIATTMLSTRYWTWASSLLPCEQQPRSCDSYHFRLQAHFLAKRAFRLRAFGDALAFANGDECRRYPTLRICNQLVAAASAHQLERERDARALIDAAIPSAEAVGSAPMLRDAYKTAARITGEERFEDQAREIARLLSA
jgi:hypothetical protein